MTSMTATRNGDGTTGLEGSSSQLHGEDRLAHAGNGTHVRPEGYSTDGRLYSAGLNGNGNGAHDERQALAVFCYPDPDSVVGQYVRQIVPALARRGVHVHLFSVGDFGLAAPGVSAYPLGACDGADILESADEFARRACNVFLEHFPASRPVTLLGCEWSSARALSILRGIRNAHTILSIHSLERQRSDMKGEISRRIEEVELSELRQARGVLVHDPSTAEVAKYWAPECAPRLTLARQPFPVASFESAPDAGAIKARYQVGPVDPTVVYVGDLSHRYGPDLLVKAMPALLKDNKQVRLVIVGDGDMLWPLKVYARYLLLEHAVRVVGSLEGQAVRELIQAADVVAIPSREPTPWWPIQAAWAARRPVVATHQAAPPLLEHEQDSLLVYPSENSLVWGIQRMLNDPKTAQAVSAYGRQKLEDRFGWGCLAEQVQELMSVPVLQ